MMDLDVQTPTRPTHNRSRSTGILKSIIKPSSRTPSPRKRTVTGLQSGPNVPNIFQDQCVAGNFLPADHPHSNKAVLSEIHNDGPKSPRKASSSPKKQAKKPALEQWEKERDTVISPAESALLTSQPRDYFQPKEKENTTPPRPSNEIFTPIYAQFTSHPNEQISILQKGGSLGMGSSGKQPQSPSKAESAMIKQPMQSPLKQSPLKGGSQMATSTTPRASGDVNGAGQPNARNAASASPKKKSRVMAAVAKLNGTNTEEPVEVQLEGKELEDKFEAVLVARNIPSHRRSQMRDLDVRIKREFIKQDQGDTPAVAKPELSSKPFFVNFKSEKGDRPSRKRAESSTDDASFDDDKGSPSKRSRSRSRTFTFSKRSRSNSRPRSLMSLKNLSSSSVNSVGASKSQESSEKASLATPEDFTTYLKAEQSPQKVEVGKIHKLRLILRNETVSWVESFVSVGGMDTLIVLLRRIMQIEWREDHEDLLLNEVLLCLKALCTTRQALERLADLQTTLFPELLKMLFDDEKKGPSEYSTRSIIISLLFTHLAAADSEQQAGRASTILSHLSNPTLPEDERPAGFIEQMQQRRPYQLWCREVTNVTKEVFWIFLHHLNVISTSAKSPADTSNDFMARHFPRERPPVPAAPYVGGVEWDATNYLAAHLDLLNGLVASLPSSQTRNSLRNELKVSGFEKIMGGALRLCKEKFYGAVHDGLRTWVAAAAEDGWDFQDVRNGPPKESRSSQSPTKNGSPWKGDAPKLELPVLGLDGAADGGKADAWL